jgi:hypothetical protein
VRLPPPEFWQFAGPVFQQAQAAGFIDGGDFEPYEWRPTAPPFAMATRTALQSLTEEHYRWFRRLDVFPRLMVREVCELKSGAQFVRDSLYLFQLIPEPVTGNLYHATPASRKSEIEASGGLKPGRLSRVSTTKFNGSDRWIHVVRSLEEAQTWVKKERLLAARSGINDWVVLKIPPRGTAGHVFADPASETGFVLPDDLVPWGTVEVIEGVRL